MTIPKTALVPVLSSLTSAPIVDPQTGLPSQTMRLWMQKVFDFINSMNRLIPVNCSNVSNLYTLTVPTPWPVIAQYSDYDTYIFVASATSTGLVTANVATSLGNLATINVYKSNGAAQATTGDVVLGSLYLASYNDALNSGAGGLVIK